MTQLIDRETRRSAIGQIAFDHAPRWLSWLVFSVGGCLLMVAATPITLPGNVGLLSLFIGELPNYLAALKGLLLMVMAVGLYRRVRAAHYITVGLLVAGFVTSYTLQPSHILAVFIALLLAVMMATHHAFFRRSNLSVMRPGSLWFLMAAIVVAVAAVGAALWAGHEQGFIEAKWWDLILHPAIGMAGRPVLLVAIVLAVGAFVCLVAAPQRPQLPAPENSDFARVDAILAGADSLRPESALAFSGDKSFLYSPSGDSFLMYAAGANTLVALGGPIGRNAEAVDLLRRFQTLAQEKGVEPAIYAAATENLPALLEAGFAVEKIGENAILDLETFSLSGRKREVIRRGRRKLAQRRAGRFRMSLPPHEPSVLDALEPISEAWLAQNGSEKAFSLGRFDRDFLNRSPIGIVEIDGKTAAFGSLWTTPEKCWAGIDLMRYDPDIAVTNTMDFLLVEMILWAQAEAYRRFDLSMAPLSGLESTADNGLFARVGQMIFRHGERFYNFQGLRRFKQKFNPQWEPRYLAVPKRLSLPVALADAAILTNGGIGIRTGGRASARNG